MLREVYQGYLGYALNVSVFLTLIASLYIFAEHANGHLDWQSPASNSCWLGVCLSMCILVFCSLVKSDTNEERNPFAQVARFFLAKDISYIARVSTAVFMAYALAIVLLVFGTGGSSASPFSPFLLVGATFGYGLANSKYVKRAVVFVPLVLHVCLIFIHSSNSHLFVWDFNPSLSPTYIASISVTALVAFMTYQDKG